MADNPICMNEERARRLMAVAGLDVLLANSVFNVAYLSGFVQYHWVWDGIQHFMDRNIWRDEAKPLAGFCLDPSKSPFLACNEWVTRHNFIYPTVEIVMDWKSYGGGLHANQFAFYSIDWTVRALRERGLEAARIGYEETRLPVYYLECLGRELPAATFIPADNLFWRIRAVKTPEELRRLREAFRIAVQVYHETFAMLKPGIVLGDITRMQMERAHELGGLWYFNHLWLHTPSTQWDMPADYKLKAGDEGGCDLGIYYQGYGSDFGRTVSLGPVHEEIQREFDSVRAVYDGMKDAARIGNSGADIYEAAQKVIREQRNGRGAGCLGHGLGLECHEIPAILPTENEPLEENMVIQIEVGSVEPPRNTYIFLEDAGVVTPRGWELLNDLAQDIVVTDD
ncbi:MAG TPA: M24 family metallopeptidase [Abditibacteriaceae bacterium]|nr:M24 family metallopeptidase [Abditibacteriaceae bacterium]